MHVSFSPWLRKKKNPVIIRMFGDIYVGGILITRRHQYVLGVEHMSVISIRF